MKKGLLLFILLGVVSASYQYWGHSNIEDKIVEAKNTIKNDIATEERSRSIASEKNAIKKLPGSSIVSLKSKMSKEALNEVERLEKMGFELKYRDNNNGTMAIVIENKEAVYKLDNLYTPEQWEKVEAPLLSEVNKNAKKTDLTDEEISIVDKWKQSME